MSVLKRAARPTPSFVVTAALLVAGVAPWPGRWGASVRQAARSPDLNRADHEAAVGGYYEGLVGVGSGGRGAGRGELALSLQGRPADWVRFQDSGVARPRADDFLQFELRADQDELIFGRRFTTNALAMRDREYAPSKPEGTFRVLLVGSSIDMGWGVGTDETYENLLEDWLNAHASRRGLSRRFEVWNGAVAAYGPAQRLEAYRRRAARGAPDLVIYSMTMLDPRLVEIHTCGLLQNRLDLRYDFLRDAVAAAGITAEDLRRDVWGDLVRKDVIKRKLAPQRWSIADAALGALAADCRSQGRPLLALVVPRAGAADAPAARSDAVARIAAMARAHDVPLVDLSGTFDDQDAEALEIAACDDHPNARGHRLLFLALARALVRDRSLYCSFFGVEPPPGPLGARGAP
jgi:hypothetical protein